MGISLEESLMLEINKNYEKTEGDKLAYILENNNIQDRIDPTEIPGYISTGSDMLDLAISNIPNGGIPMGRITELNGLEGSGKSLIGAHILANTQKVGGIAVYIDTESAANNKFLKVIGVDLSKLIYVRTNNLEKIYEIIDKLIVSTRKINSDVPVTILFDSMAGASPETEIEDDYGRDGYATAKALINSKALRKLTIQLARKKITLVITNQLRANMQSMGYGSDKYTTPGGMAIQFYSSVRVRLSKALKIKNKNTKDVIGLNLKAKIDKNRVGPPHRETSFQLYFSHGIDNVGSWLEVLKQYNIIGANSFEYDGRKITYTADTFSDIINKEEHKEIKEWLYSKICENIIMEYSDNSILQSEIDLTDEEIES